MGDGVCCFEAVGEERIELSFGVEEVVIGVDDDYCCVGRHCEVGFGE